MTQNIPRSKNKDSLHLLLLGLWLIIGMSLRFAHLDAKPASSIEIATLGFSLGHGFAGMPLDRIVDISTLLTPLKFDPALNYSDVFNRLMSESTHPPLYFWLTHWWVKLFADDEQLVSLTLARSLSAIFGGLAIPAIFGLSWVAFRSRLIAHLAAALMAVAEFRKVDLGFILAAGDDISGLNWDQRLQTKIATFPERFFWLAADFCITL